MVWVAKVLDHGLVVPITPSLVRSSLFNALSRPIFLEEVPDYRS